MTTPSNRSSLAIFSCTDGVAAKINDVALLVGRILIALVFLMTVWFGSPNVGYLTSLGLSGPGFWSGLALAVEWVIVVSLILGIATRYGALLGLLFVIIATVLAHRYWQYPPAQQGVQYIFLTKNLAIMGGLVLLFINGGGRYSIDQALSGRN